MHFYDSIHELATDPLGYCMLLTQFSNYKFEGQPMHKNDTLQMRIHTDDKEML